MNELFECIYEGFQIGVKAGVAIVVVYVLLCLAHFLFLAACGSQEDIERDVNRFLLFRGTRPEGLKRETTCTSTHNGHMPVTVCDRCGNQEVMPNEAHSGEFCRGCGSRIKGVYGEDD